MATLAIVAIGSMPINDANAQSRSQSQSQYRNEYYYQNQGGQQKQSFGQHYR
jgi:hypothetical protein